MSDEFAWFPRKPTLGHVVLYNLVGSAMVFLTFLMGWAAAHGYWGWAAWLLAVAVIMASNTAWTVGVLQRRRWWVLPYNVMGYLLPVLAYFIGGQAALGEWSVAALHLLTTVIWASIAVGVGAVMKRRWGR